MASAARLSVQRLPALCVLTRQSCALSVSSRLLPPFPQHSTKLFRRAQHQNALSPSPTDASKNPYQIIDDLITPDLYTRTVSLTNVTSFAIEDDLRELFAESGFKHQRIIMFYRGLTGNNSTQATVIMADESTAKAAVDELNGAPLFNQRLVVKPFDIELVRVSRRNNNVTNGWVASKIQDLNSVRAPLMSPPKDIFRPVREGRRVVLDIPQPADFRINDIHALFYSYNVDAISWQITYVQKKKTKSDRKCWHIDFSTREEADDAVRVFHKFKFKGCQIHVAKYQVPLKYLGTSWDAGAPGAHFSGRDQGSAVGTNYEHVQDEIFAKAILGRWDRKLWVPTHTY